MPTMPERASALRWKDSGEKKHKASGFMFDQLGAFREVARKYYSPESIRERLGIPDPFDIYGEEMDELRRIKREGVDPFAYRQLTASKTGESARGLTQEYRRGASMMGVQLGDEMTMGVLDRLRGEYAGRKVHGFGEVMADLIGKDTETRERAKNFLLELLFTQARLDQELVLSERQRQAALRT